MADPAELAGRYTLKALLGRGGMGEVYEAWDSRLRRAVAIKLPRSDARDVSFADRVLKEARTAAALNHPNVVAIYDVGVDAGVTYIVMELVSGTSLRALLGRDGPTLAVRVRWLATIARALGAAHALGLVHRDVKPDNVLVRADGQLKVLDFGVARQTVQAHDPTGVTTGEGVIVGTPAYMAPEQARAEKVDGRADQFAWGVLAYELIVGALPWASTGSFASILAAVLTESPVGPYAAHGIGSHAIDAVLLRALSKERSERFPSMETLADALDTALSSDLHAPTLAQSSVPAPAGRRVTDTPAPATTPAAAAAAYLEALRAFRDGDWGRARDRLEASISSDEALAPAHLRLALIFALEPAYTRDPRVPFRRAVQLRESLGAADRALLRCLEPIVSFDPSDRFEARRRFESAVTTFPNDAELHLAAAIFSQDATQLHLAERAVAIDPGYSDAWCLLGRAYASVGRQEDATRALEHAIEISPHAVDAYHELTRVCADRGDAAGAEQAARRAVAIAPSMTGYARLLGAVHARGGRPAALRAIATSLLAVTPPEEVAPLTARLGVVLAVLRGDIAEAEQHASEFLRLVAGSNAMVVRTDATRFAITLALERGALDHAATLALDYLDQREVWRQARRPSGDATPFCVAVARLAGKIDARTAAEERRAWIERYAVVGGWSVFALAYAPAIDDAAAIEEARAAVPNGAFDGHGEIEARLNDPLLGAEAASILNALGRHAEAAEAARRASRSCNATQDPFRSTHAYLALAEALVASGGDADEAIRAVEVVLERWGNNDLVSVQRARAVRARLR
jgi:serine/threonine-protein kinase